jgi:hypothetical protein
MKYALVSGADFSGRRFHALAHLRGQTFYLVFCQRRSD